MPKRSLEELRGQISAGEYRVDSGTLAADMLAKFDLIRRVRRLLIGGNGARGTGAPPSRIRRGPRPAPPSVRRGTNAAEPPE